MEIKEYNEESIINLMKNYETVDDFLSDYIYESSTKSKSSKEILDRLTLKYKHNKNLNVDSVTSIERLYFDVYKMYIKVPIMLRENWKEISKSKVDKAMILQVGKYFIDGFSGIQVKNISYSDNYIFSVEDGENGILFIKTYQGFPELAQLIEDSVLAHVLINDGKTFKKSVRELHKKAMEDK